MTPVDMQQAVRRIMAGERATVVVPAANYTAAQQLLAKLPPRQRALLTLAVRCPNCGNPTTGHRENATEYCTVCGTALGPASTAGPQQ